MQANKLHFTENEGAVSAAAFHDDDEECLFSCELTKARAIECCADLLETLALIGATRADIERAIPGAPPPSTLWGLFEASYGTCIQRDDSPDDGREPLADDNAALELCISEATAGNAHAIEALAEIARAHHDACLGD